MTKVKSLLKEKKFYFICFFWFIISVQFIMGYNLQVKGYLFREISELIIDLIKIIILNIFFVFSHFSILRIYNKKEDKDINNYNKTKYRFIKYFLIIILCWIPTLLAFYPSIVSYDGGYQIKDYVFKNELNHHPIIITKLYSMFYLIGIALNSVNKGMLLFSIFQMTFMGLIFSFVVKFIEDETKSKLLRNISIIFYALFPYNQLFSIMTTKDVIFSGLFLIFIINLYFIVKEKKSYWLRIVFIIVLGILMLLSRNNAVYTLIVSLPFLFLILFGNKAKAFKVLSIFLIIIVGYKTINNSLYNSINSKSDEGNLRVTMFSQAAARIAKDKKDELTEEEKEKIKYYFTEYNKFGRYYKPNIADVSLYFTDYKAINNNRKDFFKFMFELFKKYPITCIESTLDTTRGFWYLYDNSFNNIWNEYSDDVGALELYCYPVDKNFSITEDSKLPELKQFYKDMLCKNYYQNIPVINLIFQPAMYFYIVFAFLLFSIYKKNKTNICIAIVIFLFFASCYMANCSIVRYIYPVIVCTPVILALSKNNKKGESI